jgi:site-specific recombinase XerD
LIDERGSPLSPKAFYTAISRANAKHQRLKITPHVLRHIYACRFLQRAIEVDAHARGLAIAELTRQQIEEFAEMPLDVLRLELGHASVETTRKYVEMLIHDWIAPRYHEAWNSVLDAVE